MLSSAGSEAQRSTEVEVALGACQLVACSFNSSSKREALWSKPPDLFKNMTK